MNAAQQSALALRRAGWPWRAIYLAVAHERAAPGHFDPKLWATILDIFRRDATPPCRVVIVGGRWRKEWT